MEQKKKQGAGQKKIALVGLGVAIAGAVGYWGWSSYRKRQQAEAYRQAESEAAQGEEKQNGKNITSTGSKWRDDKFPLQRWSSGERVKQLQQAIMNKYGAEWLKDYGGADGKFGAKTEEALLKNGLPIVLDLTAFQTIVGGDAGRGSAGIDVADTAKKIQSSILSGNFATALTELRKLQTAEDYKTVSDYFKTNFKISLTSKTVVTALFDKFTKDDQRQELFAQFKRMGLSYDGAKWHIPTLTGIVQGTEIITTATTPIFSVSTPVRKIEVRKNIVLGKKEFANKEWMYFKPYGSHQLYRVRRQHVKKHK